MAPIEMERAGVGPSSAMIPFREGRKRSRRTFIDVMYFCSVVMISLSIIVLRSTHKESV